VPSAECAFEAFIETGGDPDAPVMHEINYEETTITLRAAAGMMMHCTDQLPGEVYDELADTLGRKFRSSYAGAGFAMLRSFQKRGEGLKLIG
jgi:hypothetical protein